MLVDLFSHFVGEPVLSGHLRQGLAEKLHQHIQISPGRHIGNDMDEAVFKVGSAFVGARLPVA